MYRMAEQAGRPPREGVGPRRGIESEAVKPVEAALRRALELSENDGSIVLSAGSMFVTGEVMTAWDKMERES